MIKTIIIEDEFPACQLLTNVIREYCPKLKLVGSATNVEDGYALVMKEKPDLVFLDIQLADNISFELLDRLPYRKFKIIFTTAYEEYALKAFKYEALDYIVKPFSPKDIIQAVDKVKMNDIDEDVLAKINELFYKNEKPLNDKIKIQTSNGLMIIRCQDILRVEAEGSYSIVYTVDGKKNMFSKTLKDLESKLCPNTFYRVHASHLVNTNYVSQISSEDGTQVIMSNGEVVPISRRMKQDFINTLMGE
jgi:two-component system, LytTR family, response regulator